MTLESAPMTIAPLLRRQRHTQCPLHIPMEQEAAKGMETEMGQRNGADWPRTRNWENS